MKTRLNGLGFGLACAAMLLVAGMDSADDTAASQRPTFYKDVLPILQENCQACHQPSAANIGGMIAPMPFMSYGEVRPWAKAIVRQVEARSMPPWFASDEFDGLFSNERKLNDEEIETIARWVAQGATAGRIEDAPAPKTFVEELSDGWSIGTPDLIISIEPFFVGDDVVDLNISFTTVLTEEELPHDVWVQAIEYKAGSETVHHMCNSATAPGDRDGLDSLNRNGLGCIAPGADVRIFTEGMGTFLPKGSTIRWGMHYHKESGPGTGVWDTSQMAFKFNKTPVRHRTQLQIIGGGNGFEIPPNHGAWQVGAARTFTEPTTILGYFPHMHFRGSASEYTAFYPDGTEELLLRVAKYDYNWQTMYNYTEPKEIPAGTRVEVKMWYDNTAEKVALGARFNPDRAVSYGGPTTDEMMNGWIDFTNTIPRDFDEEIAASREVVSSTAE